MAGGGRKMKACIRLGGEGLDVTKIVKKLKRGENVKIAVVERT